GGALPAYEIPSFAVSVKVSNLSANQLEEKLRLGEPCVIARIKDDALLLDARTLTDKDITAISKRIEKIETD
ncbi:L-seryl-tRNA(Sec) selenium transferase, partial [Nitrospirota bacterium]